MALIRKKNARAMITKPKVPMFGILASLGIFLHPAHPELQAD